MVGLFLDLTKAFDCVDHKLLIKKLYGCGVRGFVLDWLNSFLSGREQKVLINKFLSGPSKIDIGVQQGSVLGPVLFIIYINSIFNLPLKGKIFCYADDIAIVYSSPNRELIKDAIYHDLQFLQSWLISHNLYLSKKSKAMAFFSDRPQKAPI